MWGGVAAGLQDNGGALISDPYSDTDNIGSSFSDLATQLVGAAANIGTSYAVSSISGGQIAPTGNPLAPTTVIPSVSQQQQLLAASSAQSSMKLLEYGAVAVIAVLVIVAVAK
jgi:hypothetical protein